VDSVAFAVAFGLFLVAGGAFALAVAERRRARPAGRHGGSRPISLDVALVACVTATLVLTLSPIDDATEIQLLPFSDVVEALLPPVDPARLLTETANILLFVPLGAVLGLRGYRLGTTAAIGLALSAAVEFAQLLLVSGRTTSVDDLLLNTLGAVLGSLALSRWLPAREVPSTP
jgi:VanZ family protein